MGLQGPPYAVLSPLVADPLAPPGDPESSLFLTCHFVFKGWWKTKSPDWAKLTELIQLEEFSPFVFIWLLRVALLVAL